MAAFHNAASTSLSLHHRRFNSTITPPAKKPLFILSHLSLPLKPTRRKNYLRQKLLKTLQYPKSNPVEEIHRQLEIIQEKELLAESETTEANNQEIEVVDTNAGSVWVKNPILKYGLWLVGSIAFQALFVACFLGSDDDETSKVSNRDRRISSVIEFGGNGKYGGGNGVDEMEIKRRIDEIRVMARGARAKERLESKRSGSGFEDEEENDEIDEDEHVKSRVEEEVDSRLVKLKKTLANAGDSVPKASPGFLRKGELDGRVENEALLYRKKHKFKGLSGDPREKPRGFVGSDDKNIKKVIESGSSEKGDELVRSCNDAVNSRGEERFAEESRIDARDVVLGADEDQEKGVKVVDLAKHTSNKVTKQRDVKKQGREKVVRNPKVKNNREPVIPTVKLRGSSISDAAARPSGLSNSNGSPKPIRVGDVKLVKKQEHDWWLNLPYVLCVLMQKGDDGEGGQGLYTLESASNTEDSESHVVAFEDRVDAANFCYVLQTFFDDLEDFNADVVPLTVKELRKEVKSQNQNVIVVKKGQLKLYAGQPLEDAEMALRAIVKDTESG